MTIYFVLFFVLTLFAFIEINIQKPIEYRIVYYLLTVFFVLMAGLRFKTGYDIDVYKEIYAGATGSNYQEYLLEPGSFLIIFLSHSLNLSFQVYLFMYAIFAVALKQHFFAKYSPYLFVALLVYYPIGFLINEMGQIRHGLAIGIVLIAFSFLFQNKNKLFFLFTFTAIFFHVSALIVLPVYFFVNRTFKPAYLLLSALALSVIVLFDSRPLFLSVLDHIPIPTIQSKARLYLYSEEFGLPLGFNISFLLRLLIFWVMVYFRDTGKARFAFYDKLIWLYFYGIVVYAVFNSISEFAIRFSTYFKALDSIILACLITFGRSRVEKNLVWLIVVLYSLFSIYKLLYDPVSSPSFVPYRSIFSS